MGLVLYALKYRITFYVMTVFIVLAGIGAIIVAPKDVLPNVDIPVVTVVWTYTGLDATDMAQRVTTYSEFSLSNNVNNIRRMESSTLTGVAVERIYFDQNVSIDLAITQVVSAMNSIRAAMPPGIQPPIVMRFSASSVPVIQLALSSRSETLAKVYDYGQYRIRQTLTQVPGSTLPSPSGGAPRQVMVDLDLHALQGYGLTPQDVLNAITAQNLIVPSGLAKIGETQYPIKLNASPTRIEDLNLIPIKVVNNAPILIRDVANVRDGSPPQLNIVRSNGTHSILQSVLKNGEASTLDVVDHVKQFLPQIRAAAPKGMEITPLGDQSVFVSGAIADVIREAAIAAALTGAMILLFLGSWRSTLVVLVSIPLAILSSLAVLVALHQTINIMTLGGLALAVGILVDDATVAIENTYRLMEDGARFRDAVVEGASGIAKPALISTLSICAAFVSVLFLTDAPKYIFTPQALAVVLAMLASYLLSRTLVPILINLLIRSEYAASYGRQRDDEGEAGRDGDEGGDARHGTEAAARPGALQRFGTLVLGLAMLPLRAVGRPLAGPARWAAAWLGRLHKAFDRGFGRFQKAYVGLLHASQAHRVVTLGIAGVVVAMGGVLFAFVGQDYFPAVDGGAMTLHIRTRPGMRLETAEQTFAAVENAVRDIVPARELGLILDNIGLPASNYNFAFGDGSFVAYNDGQMTISLNEGHAPTAFYMKKLREALPRRFPDTIFYFQPSDMITQILDFGTVTPIDVQVSGRNEEKDLEIAKELRDRLREVRGAVDVHIQQITDAPELFVDVDRRLAAEIGLTEQQVANAMNISLSGSFQVSPNFWADPKTGIPYQVWVQTPEYRNDNLNALKTTPLFVTLPASSAPAGAGPTSAALTSQPGVLSLLSSVATFHRRPEQTVINHVNTQPTFDVYASAQDRDLGGIKRDILKIVAEEQKKLPAPDKITVRGQIESMDSAFGNLSLGLAIAVVAVYLLMAINFQSWGDPFVIIAALPVAFSGILTSLFVTGTTLSIPSLFGAIMSVGVASANSILLVTFARERREETGCSAAEAAVAAGETRLRPVLMTAGAMFVGLIPMAIGIGEGSEQNAALARAVLGGVAFGTCSTLLFVPFLYALMRSGPFRPVKDYR